VGATVTVGCKLPNGLIAEVGDVRIRFAGANDSDIVGGHGITEDVPKEFWDAFVAKYGGFFVPLIKGLIFAHDRTQSANAMAKERRNEKTGLEGLNPKNVQKNGVESAVAA